MVSTTNATSERAFVGRDNEPAGVTRQYIGEINGQPAGAYASDRGMGPRINTTFTPDETK
ncbi:unnamed protein product, partial [Adineta ricciae]